jgi:HlyD family secretion protein
VVKKGDLLVKINPDLYTSVTTEPWPDCRKPKPVWGKQMQVSKKPGRVMTEAKSYLTKAFISKSEWDKAVATFESANAARQSAYYNVQSASATVNEAKDNLGRTTIYAPADGTISMLNVELGERVLGTQQMTGTEILRVANLNNMEVEVDVNENDIVKINVGDSANVEVDAISKSNSRDW